MRGHPRDIRTVQMNAAGIRADLARDLGDQGGLAGPIRADQSVDFTGAYIEIDAVRRLQRAEGFGKAGD